MIQLNFKKRISFGFGIIYTIILFAAIYVVLQLSSIGGHVELIYNHPFKVSNAIRDIRIECYKIDHFYSDFNVVESRSEADSLMTGISHCESIIDSNFKVLYSQYLGKKSDIDSVFNALVVLRNVKNKLYEHKIENKTESIKLITKNFNSAQLDKIIGFSKVISDFAFDRAQNEMNQSFSDEKQTHIILISILALISTFVLLLSSLISRSITIY